MPRRTILMILWVVMLVGALGASYVGYRYFTRNRVAVGTYRMPIPEGDTIRDVINREKALMTSEDLLKGVITDLDLTTHWDHDGVEETLAHMRESLLLQPGGEDNMLRVIYLDRNQEMALTVLREISGRYVEIKRQQPPGDEPLK